MMAGIGYPTTRLIARGGAIPFSLTECFCEPPGQAAVVISG